MGGQVETGKAFEYAFLLALYRQLSSDQLVEIDVSRSLMNARQAYTAIQPSQREDMDCGAFAAVKMLCELEPQLRYPGQNVPLYLSIQEDSAGVAGDVRDVLAVRRQNEWGIGFSAKHNHSAMKHSRLSNTIDFGDSWFGTPCSLEYFAEIKPVFDELNLLRSKGAKWREIENKEERFYQPILQAFMRELTVLHRKHGAVIPQELLKYFIGRHDFYKVIANTRRRVTKIQAFSFHGSLNMPSGDNRPLFRIPQIRLPETIHSVDFKPGSKTTVNIVCDQGWQISARIHNASSKVEPSLKFDIRLAGLPPNVYSHDEPWGEHTSFDWYKWDLLVAEHIDDWTE